MAGTLATLQGASSEEDIRRTEWRQDKDDAYQVEIIDADMHQASFVVPDVATVSGLHFVLEVENDSGDISTQRVAYLASPKLPDWAMHQGNAAHTGHIPAAIFGTRFPKLWEWTAPPGRYMSNVNPPASIDGKVFVGFDRHGGEQRLYALGETDGAELWYHSFGEVFALTPPAVENGIISLATTGRDDTFFWNINAATGEVISHTPFSTQYPRYLAATLFDGTAYNAAGYYRGEIIAFSQADGGIIWNSRRYGDNDLFTPAVDADHVYHYSGEALVVLDRASGTLLYRIADPDPHTTGTGHRHYGSPVIGYENTILSFSGDSFAGTNGSSSEQNWTRKIIAFDVQKRSMRWKSNHAYFTNPAVADGFVFVASTTPLQLEVLRESDGSIAWTWTPETEGITGFHRNIIVTDNLIFVSSDVAVHAISRDTRQEVWSAPTPGLLGLLHRTSAAKVSSGSICRSRSINCKSP
jgi:outer membrane protein assembly factor BamB